MQKDWLSVYEFIPVKERRVTWIDVGEQQNHIESIIFFFVCKKLIDKPI